MKERQTVCVCLCVLCVCLPLFQLPSLLLTFYSVSSSVYCALSAAVRPAFYLQFVLIIYERT